MRQSLIHGASWRPSVLAALAGQRRRLLPVCRTAVAWASLIGLAFFLLSALSLRTDNARETSAVRQAFADGTLRADANWLGGNTTLGSHQWNDCLILYQAINRVGPADRLILSPIVPTAPEFVPCLYLEALSRGARTTLPLEHYHRYLHGHTVLTRLLLARLSVDQIRAVYSAMMTLVLMLGLAVSMMALARGERRTESGFWMLTLLIVSRWFGLESFAQSLGHGPSDLVVAGGLSFLAHASASGGIAARRIPAFAAVFGALTILFEFLTGGIPLGLAILIGGLPFAVRSADIEGSGRLLWLLIEAIVGFVVSITTMLAIKAALLIAVLGAGPAGSVVRPLLFRMGINLSADYGRDGRLTWGDAIANILGGFNSLAAGSMLMAMCMLATGLCAGSWGLRRLIAQGASRRRDQALALAVSNLAIVCWLALFWQHSAEHARFMDRILVWPIASGMALFLLAVLSASSEPPSSAGSPPRSNVSGQDQHQ